MRLFKQVELKDGELVQFVGVYVTRWQPEWGQPSVGFVEVDENEQRDSANKTSQGVLEKPYQWIRKNCPFLPRL